MKKAAIAILVCVMLVIAIGAGVLFQRRADATVACIPLDGGIRPRSYCVMNPFRDRSAELNAESVLGELKSGNTSALLPYLPDLDDGQRERHLSNESVYRIVSWRIGGIEVSDQLSIKYWVSRSNYPGGEEEATFYFSRSGDQWKLDSYNAIY